MIAPLLSMILFLILVGGASYAFYSHNIGSYNGSANISNARLSVPKGCIFLANATNCVITSNAASSINTDDEYISGAEMTYDYRNHKIATSSCELNIGVQGENGCTCTYNVDVVGQTTTNFVSNSLKLQVMF